MKIELADEIVYLIKDSFMIELLKDDISDILSVEHTHPDDVKEYKKLIKAYKRILKYYGVDNG
jgi:hypothetical protein